MGFFGKIKNILFEDDPEDEMPVYTKDEIRDKDIKKENIKEEVNKEEEISTVSESRIKRDYEIDEELVEVDDDLVEIPDDTSEIPIVREQRKSPFVNFDEDELCPE